MLGVIDLKKYNKNNYMWRDVDMVLAGIFTFFLGFGLGVADNVPHPRQGAAFRAPCRGFNHMPIMLLTLKFGWIYAEDLFRPRRRAYLDKFIHFSDVPPPRH